jgi:uncharacterized membrane protein
MFALIGSALEVGWYEYLWHIRHEPDIFPVYYTFTPLRVSYGIGAVVLILVLTPLLRKIRNVVGKMLVCFGLGMVLCTAVELVASLLLVLRMGYNPLWDYSAKPFNFYGHICLENSLLFGAVSVGYIFAIYPLLEKLFTRMRGRALDIFFLVIFSSFAIDLLLLGSKTLYSLAV